MAKTFHLTIAKVGENLFEGEALSVTLPGIEGVFTIMAGHEAFVSPLKEGEAVVTDASGSVLKLPLSGGGIAEISGGQATVLL